jgi:hypothetical protein
LRNSGNDKDFENIPDLQTITMTDMLQNIAALEDES